MKLMNITSDATAATSLIRLLSNNAYRKLQRGIAIGVHHPNSWRNLHEINVRRKKPHRIYRSPEVRPVPAETFVPVDDSRPTPVYSSVVLYALMITNRATMVRTALTAIPITPTISIGTSTLSTVMIPTAAATTTLRIRRERHTQTILVVGVNRRLCHWNLDIWHRTWSRGNLNACNPVFDDCHRNCEHRHCYAVRDNHNDTDYLVRLCVNHR